MEHNSLLVLIESDSGQITSDNAFCGWYGAKKFAWLDKDGYEIKITTMNGLSVIIPMNKDRNIFPIGSADFMKKAAGLFDFNLPDPINIPESLKTVCGRKTWICKKEDIQYPCFIKPLTDMKLFTGFVIESPKAFQLYPELKEFNGEFFCSDIIENIISEWRCFILNGKILNCSNYNGNPLIFPDKFKIEHLVKSYYDAPAGYSLDVCVTNNGTKLVEINDGWSLGNYGCDPQDYFKILKARWFELIRQKEEFVNVNVIL